jgi:hypothetical protein
MGERPLRAVLEDAATAYQDEDFELAERLARRACRMEPGSLDAWDFHSIASQALDRGAEAERSCRKALALARASYGKNPDDDKLAMRQIFILMRLGWDEEIEELFKQLLLRHPGHARLERLMATWRLRQR